jgi:hypothetical protein
MKTVTYGNLGRKTSECGINGRVIKFEYDDFNRLEQVTDELGNLLKGFLYQYQK